MTEIINLTIPISKKIIKEAEKKGITIEDSFIAFLTEKLNIDPHTAAQTRLELAKKFLREAKTYIEKDNPIQASEKLYKTAEECIKALAEYLKAPQATQAKKQGRWFTWQLGQTARWISQKVKDPIIRTAWTIAYDIHVWGFHEAKYNTQTIKSDLPYIEKLLKTTERIITKQTAS